MATPDSGRIDQLEREIQLLKARIAALERILGTGSAEHPIDRGTVQKKVVYDWQQ